MTHCCFPLWLFTRFFFCVRLENDGGMADVGCKDWKLVFGVAETNLVAEQAIVDSVLYCKNASIPWISYHARYMIDSLHIYFGHLPMSG